MYICIYIYTHIKKIYIHVLVGLLGQSDRSQTGSNPRNWAFRDTLMVFVFGGSCISSRLRGRGTTYNVTSLGSTS